MTYNIYIDDLFDPDRLSITDAQRFADAQSEPIRERIVIATYPPHYRNDAAGSEMEVILRQVDWFNHELSGDWSLEQFPLAAWEIFGPDGVSRGVIVRHDPNHLGRIYTGFNHLGPNSQDRLEYAAWQLAVNS